MTRLLNTQGKVSHKGPGDLVWHPVVRTADSTTGAPWSGTKSHEAAAAQPKNKLKINVKN